MNRYAALIDGTAGAYGVVFPDLPGICAMGDTIDEALVNAEDALHDYAVEVRRDGSHPAEPTPLESIEVPNGTQLVSIPLSRQGRVFAPDLLWTQALRSLSIPKPGAEA